MYIDLIVMAVPVYLLTIVLELTANVFRREKVYRLNNAFSNLGCGILTELYGVPLKIVLLALYDYTWRHFGIWDIPTNAWTFLGAVVAGDFLLYWSHRLSHRINLLWGIHVVHHQSEDFNLTVALRQSLFHDIPDTMMYLLLALAGVDTQLMLYGIAVNGIYQFFIHTEMVGKLGILEGIFNTPSSHRVHHGRNPQYLDKNYGGIFMIWDRLFGTYAPETEPVVYGITTPIRTFNPVAATFDHFGEMVRQLKSYDSIRSQWMTIVGHPGWQPNGQVELPKVRREAVVKYDLPYPKALGWYILAQFLAIYGLFAIYQGFSSHFGWPVKVFVAILVTWTLLNCAFLFEQRRWFYRLEFLRLFGVALFVMVAWQQASTHYFTLASVVIALFFGGAALVLRFAMARHFAASSIHT
jgi:alkylglycerol monooxygenase